MLRVQYRLVYVPSAQAQTQGGITEDQAYWLGERRQVRGRQPAAMGQRVALGEEARRCAPHCGRVSRPRGGGRARRCCCWRTQDIITYVNELHGSLVVLTQTGQLEPYSFFPFTLNVRQDACLV